jgi:hypothetical protein
VRQAPNCEEPADIIKIELYSAQGAAHQLSKILGLDKQRKNPDPRLATERRYNEFVQGILHVYQSVDTNVTRQHVLVALSQMPETTAEFMPFVQAELVRASDRS